MNHKPVFVLCLLVSLSLAGCMDLFGGGTGYTPRTHEFTLEITPGGGENIKLYTMNDGTPMEVIGIGFQVPGQDQLAVPNPEIRVKEGDTVILHVVNTNQLSHTLHLHGGLIPWEMDGVPYLNQMPIMPGEEFTYVFEDLKAGTYWYHCHVDAAHHIDLGMYGAFIVEEVDPTYDFDREYVLLLDEWDNCHVHGNTEPFTGAEQSGELRERVHCLYRAIQDNLAQNMLLTGFIGPLCDSDLPPELEELLNCHGHGNTPPQQSERTWWYETHPIYNPVYNTFLINGKSFPDTGVMAVKEGERVKVRMINAGDMMHSMHIHGHNMLVTHRDGYELPAPFRVDTLGIMPGERYDFIIEANNPGLWMFHDHVNRHAMNDFHDPGGMMMCFAYDGFHGVDAFGMDTSLECHDEAVRIIGQGGHGGHGGHAVRGLR